MKKCIYLIMIIMIIFLTGCNNNTIESTTDLTSITELPVDEKTKLLNIISDSKNQEYYKTETSGKTVANVLWGFNQEISGYEIKENGIYYVNSISSSTFKNIYHLAVFKDDSVDYKDGMDEEYKNTSYEEYKSVYGVIPKTSFAGYIVDESTIKSMEKLDEYYKITLDNKSAEDMVIQMKTFGSLNEIPIFESLVLNVYIDTLVRKVEVVSKYNIDITFFGKTSCDQKLTIDYTYIKA